MWIPIGMDGSLTVLVPAASKEHVYISARAGSGALGEDGRRGGQEKRRKSDFGRHCD